MKDYRIKGVTLCVVASLGLCACQATVPDEIQTSVEEAKDQMQQKMAEEIQVMLEKQMKDFLSSGKDNFSQEQEEMIEDSFKDYIKEYDLDMNQIEDVKSKISDMMTEFSEQTDKVTKEEIDAKLKEILK